MTVDESDFFEYAIETRFNDLESSFLLLECSGKHQTELYISTLHLYPYENEHKWVFGDLPLSTIERSKLNPFMRDMFTEASPFTITTEGKIEYHRQFLKPD